MASANQRSAAARSLRAAAESARRWNAPPEAIDGRALEARSETNGSMGGVRFSLEPSCRGGSGPAGDLAACTAGASERTHDWRQDARVQRSTEARVRCE